MSVWSAKGPSRPRILLVDDEEEILVALEDLLEDQYEILATTDPFRALDLLRAHPDVATIISDQRMPGLTGDQLLMRAREFSDARSILLTGYADLDAVVSALNLGQVQAYVHKPWDSDALRSLVGEVTQHCMAQRALQTEQALLRGLMEALPIGLVFSDAQGRCIRSNILDETVENAGDELTHFPDALRGEVRQMRETVRQSGQEERLIAETVPDGNDGTTQRWHELTRLALAWPQNVPSAERWQVSMDRDVTRRVLMESRLRQADKLQSLGTLAGGIAHDFNNLLAAISGSLELLEDMVELDETSGALVKNAMESAQRGAVLTRRLLQFGRPREARLAPVRLQELLPGLEALLVQSLKRRSGERSITCVLSLEELSPDFPAVWSDQDQLEMALLNLCVNARDAMTRGGTVRVSARLVGQKFDTLPPECCLEQAVAIDVIDEGEGMSPEVMKRIFDPFFTTKDVGRGTGLGLSSVYGFLSRSYGEIVVDSTLGKGTCMTLLLPVVREDALTEHQANENRQSPLQVLVIDDEAPVRMVTAGFLRHDGHDVTAVSCLADALAAVEKKGPFDLAVIDMRMPDHDGPACAAVLKEKVPGLKVLFISGHTDALPEHGKEEPLSKPFTHKSLQGAVQRLMQVETA